VRFVLVDRFVEMDPGRRAVARVTFDPALEIFADHFPGAPIVPGVLITEAMGQTAGWLIAAGEGFRRWPLLAMIDRAKFRRFVRPGEELELTACVQSASSRAYSVTAEAHVHGERVADARLAFHLVDPAALGHAPDALSTWTQDNAARLGLPAPPRA
jgi:3-hydroxyacyl-[acyl-carrier-protein] dehydratase